MKYMVVPSGSRQAMWGAYRFKSLDAVTGWRYLYCEIGSDTLFKELDVNGPFIGAMSHDVLTCR